MVQDVTENEATDKFHANEKYYTLRIESWKSVHDVHGKL